MSPHATTRPARRPIQVAAPDQITPFSLRPLQPSDREEFIRVARLSRADLDRWLPIHRPGESDDALFDRQQRMTVDGDSTSSACRRVATTPGPAGGDRVLGAFNIITITRGLELSGDLNWWTSADTLRQGIALRALRLLTAHALADPPKGLGLHLLRAYIQRDNTPSIRLAERLGMTRREDGRSYIQTGDRWAIHDLYILNARTA